MIKEVLTDCEDRMKKAISVLDEDFRSIRAGRATPSLLDQISIEYYGSAVPLKQIASVTAPEPRLLLIQPWDKTVIPLIEKAIMISDLGMMPNSDGSVIRLNVPTLTEDRRKKLIRIVRQKAEDGKVAIRNVRRDSNEEIKLYEHEHEISEDDAHRGLEQVQELTDKYIKEIDHVLKLKEAEVLEI